MAALGAVKVVIGKRTNGQADYPDFNQLAVVQASGMDWSQYVDIHGIGWHYDKTSGHDIETVDSPRGQQLGLLIVPVAFVDQAVAMFPAVCTKCNEAECQAFYDDKAHAHESAERRDINTLDSISKEKQLLSERVKSSTTSAQEKADASARLALVEKEEAKALDPNDSTPGVVKNVNKKWADMIVAKGVTFDPS